MQVFMFVCLVVCYSCTSQHWISDLTENWNGDLIISEISTFPARPVLNLLQIRGTVVPFPRRD